MPKRKERKCRFYNEYTWGEPPLEEGEKGRLYTEYECKKAKGYFVATCDGKKEHCNLKENQEA